MQQEGRKRANLPQKAPAALPCARISRSKGTSLHSPPAEHRVIISLHTPDSHRLQTSCQVGYAPPAAHVYLPEERNSGGFVSRLLWPTAEVIFSFPCTVLWRGKPPGRAGRCGRSVAGVAGDAPASLPHPHPIGSSETASGPGDPPCATNPARSNETTGPREIHR